MKKLSLIFATLLLSACGSGDDNAPPPAGPPATPTDVFLSQVTSSVAAMPDDTEAANIDAVVGTSPEDTEPVEL